MKEWTTQDFDRFYKAMDKLEFGGLDKYEIIQNSLQNASDVAEKDDPVGCAIATAEMYIDQGCSYFD